MKYISDEQRLLENRGSGTGKNYLPWIKTREVHSQGTCANPVNWHNGRITELLSQGEYYFWLILMWTDNIIDIREQYPLLPRKNTEDLCDYYRIKHPMMCGKLMVMSTDFLVTMSDGSTKAFSLKISQKCFDNPRTLDKLFIEQQYWKSIGIEYELITKDKINSVLARNIESVSKYFDRKYVFDEYSYLKHLIATKKILVDMGDVPLNFGELLHKYKKEIEQHGTSDR